jgi:hypothetical protein
VVPPGDCWSESRQRVADLDALHDSSTVPLHGLRVHAHHPCKCVERHIPNVVVLWQWRCSGQVTAAMHHDLRWTVRAISLQHARLIMICQRCQQSWLHTLFAKKRPRMLTASTRRPPIASTPMIVCTVSYRMALPAFLLPSVLVAACYTMSVVPVSIAWLQASITVCAGSTPSEMPPKIGCVHLCQDVAHLITGLGIAGSQHLQQPQHLQVGSRVSLGLAGDTMTDASLDFKR